MSEVARRFTTWISEWIETLRVAPPLSRRRRELLEILNDTDPANWVEVERPASEGPGVIGNIDLGEPSKLRRGQRLRVNQLDGRQAEFRVGEVTKKKGEPGTWDIELLPLDESDGLRFGGYYTPQRP